MEHAYKLLFIFRPLVWGMIGTLVVMFGNAFFRKLINAVAIFLLILGVCGGLFMNTYYEKLLDPYYIATTDDWMQCIVGSVTVICFLACAVAYFLVGLTVEKEGGRGVKHKKLLQGIASAIFAMMLPFAVMGYCLPFFFLDSIAGIIVGIVGEVIGLLLMIVIIRGLVKKRKVNAENNDENSDEQGE